MAALFLFCAVSFMKVEPERRKRKKIFFLFLFFVVCVVLLFQIIHLLFSVSSRVVIQLFSFSALDTPFMGIRRK